MLRIGITGGIGSGKTTISKLFGILGIPVFYADEAARALMQTDQILINDIKRAFGNSVYSDNRLERKSLAEIVFNDRQKLEELNNLVHPAVFRAFDKWVADQKKTPYVLKEAALLFESGSYRSCDKTILVTAPEQLKIARVVQRTGISANEVRMRMDRQFTELQSVELTDFIVVNDERSLLIPQVLALHQQILSLAKNDYS